MRHGERGSALIAVVLLGAILALSVAALRSLFDFALFTQVGAVQECGAHLLASAGQEDARARLQDRDYDLRVPHFVDGPVSLAEVSSLGASVRSNSSITLGSNTSIEPGALVTAAGVIRLGSAPCTLPQCRPHSPKIDLPLPIEGDVRRGAHEIVLTAANTRHGLFYIGGRSGQNRPGYAQDSSDSSPGTSGCSRT